MKRSIFYALPAHRGAKAMICILSFNWFSIILFFEKTRNNKSLKSKLEFCIRMNVSFFSRVKQS